MSDTSVLDNPVNLEDIIDNINQSNLTLFNDNHNTFEHVIICLVKYCKHTYEQAEQCAMLVHLKSKYVVKSGEKDKLVPICKALIDSGLSAEVN